MKARNILLTLFCSLSLAAGCITVENDTGGGGGEGSGEGSGSGSGTNTGGGGGGGGTTQSGVSADKPASEFTAEEEDTFCAWVAGLITEQEVIDCGNGIEVTLAPITEAQCQQQLASTPNCPVDTLEACLVSIHADPCSDTVVPECQVLDECTPPDTETSNNSGGGTDPGGVNEFCYEHTYNGDTTGEKCFATEAEYCTSLCSETNPISVDACESECS